MLILQIKLMDGICKPLRYYEFEVITTGYMKVGWVKVNADPACEVGVDGTSYGFDGFQVIIVP